MLENLKRRIEKGSKEMLRTYCKGVKTSVQREAPVLTGNLQSSVTDEEKSDTEHLVGVDADKTTEDGHDYSLDVYYGTRPHVITPKNASALHFTANGQEVFAKSVNHPGTKPNKFIDRGLANAPKPRLQI